jgi:hypothetical protein
VNVPREQKKQGCALAQADEANRAEEAGEIAGGGAWVKFVREREREKKKKKNGRGGGDALLGRSKH